MTRVREANPEGRLADVLRRWTGRIATFASYGYVGVVVLTAYEVVARYVLQRPTYWSMEICVLLAALHYLVSGVEAQGNRTHIRVDFAVNMLPEAARRVCARLRQLIMLATCALLGYAGWLQAATAISGLERSGSQLNWPVPTVLKTLVAIVLTVMSLVAIVQLASRGEDPS